jgi:hypothetical protein
MAGHALWPVNQQKRTEAFALPPQRLGAFVGLCHEGIIAKIRNGEPRAARASSLGQ